MDKINSENFPGENTENIYSMEELLIEETKAYFSKYYVWPEERFSRDIAGPVYEKLKGKENISFSDFLDYYKRHRQEINRKAKKALNLKEERSPETVSFTNMCMVEDKKGNIVSLDKVGGGYTGTTLPGGHVEKGETFSEAVIREVFEETGLKIKNPLFCGIYHWIDDGVRHVILLYKAGEFSGTLKSSQEGKVYWIPLEEYRKKELAGGMEEVLKIVCEEGPRECYMNLEEGRYKPYFS